jgi:hypothetical protein
MLDHFNHFAVINCACAFITAITARVWAQNQPQCWMASEPGRDSNSEYIPRGDMTGLAEVLQREASNFLKVHSSMGRTRAYRQRKVLDGYGV